MTLFRVTFKISTKNAKTKIIYLLNEREKLAANCHCNNSNELKKINKKSDEIAKICCVKGEAKFLTFSNFGLPNKTSTK